MKNTAMAFVFLLSLMMGGPAATADDTNPVFYGSHPLLQLVKNPAKCQECKDTWQACRQSCDAALDNCKAKANQAMCENLWSLCMAQNCDPQYNACYTANC